MPLLHLLIGLCLGIFCSYFISSETGLYMGCLAFIIAFATSFIVSKSSDTIVKSNHRYLIAFACLFGFIGFFKMQLTKNAVSDLKSINNSNLSGVVFRTSISESGYQTLHIELKNQYQENHKLNIRGNVMLTLDTSTYQYQIGDAVLFHSKLKAFENTNNPGAFDAEFYFSTHGYVGSAFLSSENIQKTGEANGIGVFFARWQKKLSEYIKQKLPESVSGLAVGLLVGVKGDLNQETLQAFTNTGTMHVLAVSGMHVGIILLVVQQFLSLFSRWFTKKQSIVISILFIVGFGLLSGASSAVMRAVIMFSIIAIGQLFERKGSTMNSLILSALLLLLYNPYYLFDVGFQLSYAALLGILVLQQPIKNLFHFNLKPIQWLWEGTAVGIAASITTFPFVLFWFQQFPTYFLFSNIVVMILGTVAIILLIGLLCFSWVPILNQLFVAINLFWLMVFIESIVFISNLPGSVAAGFQLSWVVFCLLLICFSYFIYQTIALKKVNKWSLICVVILLGYLTFNRQQEFLEDKLQLFASKEICGSLQVDQQIVYFYQTDSRQTQRIIQDAQRNNGLKPTKTIQLKNKNTIKIGISLFRINACSTGWQIQSGNQTWVYKQQGTPSKNEDSRLLSTRLQSALNQRSLPFKVNL